MSSATVSDFSNIDLTGTKPTTVPLQTVQVLIEPTDLFKGFSRAFVAEASRVAYRKAEQVKLTEEEVEKYITFLLQQRVLCVLNMCDLYRKLKALYIPSWIQYNMSLVGEVIIREEGLRFIPTMEKREFDFNEMLQISEKIGCFERDLQIVRDAMPRSTQGDINLMSTAQIAGMIRSVKPVQHVSYTYSTAFLGMKLREEAMFQILYRQQYDHYDDIAAVLLSDHRILGGAE